MAWNIRAGGGRRVGMILDQLVRWEPDVVALSEYRGTEPSRLLAESLAGAGLFFQEHTASAATPGENALMIASRWPLHTLRAQHAPAEPRRWNLVSVDAPDPLCLGAMHIPNRVTGRKEPYLAAVLDVACRWRRGPAMLLGDTNTGRIGLDEQVPFFNRREDGWMRALDAFGWTDSFRHLHGEARAYTWYSPNGGNGFRLDHAFVNRRLLPRLQGVWYEWGRPPDGSGRRDALSDHAAMIVDLTRVKGPPALYHRSVRGSG